MRVHQQGLKRSAAAIRKRLLTSAGQLWLALAAFLGIGMLPCPECGTPMILHLWPLAGLIAIVQALRQRYKEKAAGVSHLNVEEKKCSRRKRS